MAEQVIQPPNEAEMRWVGENLRLAADLGERLCGKREALPSLELLGTTFATWAQLPPDRREHPNVVVNALGLAFGQHLVNAAGLQWAVVSDEKSTDIAVHGQPGDILVFPANATAKRCESGDYDFFTGLFEEMMREIARMRSAWQGHGDGGGRTRA